MNSELKLEKSEEIIQVFMGNQYAFEFLLAVLCYYLYHYPQDKHHVNYLMNSMNLLEESKYFLSCESVKFYMREYYKHLDEVNVFEEYLDRIEDANIALMIWESDSLWVL